MKVARRLRDTFMEVLRRRPLDLAAVLILIPLAIQTFTKRESEWNEVFVSAGRRLLAGEELYGGSSYLYPPFMALISAPFSILPPMLSRALWFAASAAAFIVMVRTAWLLSRGPLQTDRWDKWELSAALLGLACGLTYILNAFAHQQVDIMIGALVMLGCLQLAADRAFAGAGSIGIAAAIKATPLLFAPYLLLRRQIVAAMLIGIVAVAVNLLPNLVSTPPGGGTWLDRWVQIFLATQQVSTPLGLWGSDLIYNQSLGGTAQRLVNTVLGFQHGTLTVIDRPLIPPAAIKIAYYSLLMLMLVASVIAATRATPMCRGPAPIVFQCGLVITLMLLMSPMSSKAHFGILVLPGFSLARFGIINRDRAIIALVAGAACLTVACNKDPLGETLYTALLWSGSVTLATLLLWLGCVLALLRSRIYAKI